MPHVLKTFLTLITNKLKSQDPIFPSFNAINSQKAAYLFYQTFPLKRGAFSICQAGFHKNGNVSLKESLFDSQILLLTSPILESYIKQYYSSYSRQASLI